MLSNILIVTFVVPAGDVQHHRVRRRRPRPRLHRGGQRHVGVRDDARPVHAAHQGRGKPTPLES